MKVEIVKKLDTTGIKNQLLAKKNRARQIVKNQVVKDTDPYVPFDTGKTAETGRNSSTSDDEYIRYTTDYSRIIYYDEDRVYSKRKHSLAIAKWFDVSKAVNKSKWIKTAKKAFK